MAKKVKNKPKIIYSSIEELKLSNEVLIDCVKSGKPPKGFVITTATTPQLRKLNVATIKGVIDVNKFMNHKKLITVNVIRKEDVEKVDDYLKWVSIKNSEGFKEYDRAVMKFISVN